MIWMTSIGINMKNTVIMKRIIYAILAIVPLVANSQNMYNVTGLLENDPAGTARFVGMGGSMGALGGNLSVMGTNPAGTAVYRSSDFYISGVVDIVKNNSVFNGTASSMDCTGTALSDLGAVIACEIDGSPVKFVNFGINYRRKNNLRSDFSMNGNPGAYSQLFIIDNLYRLAPFDINKITSDSYRDFNYNWLALLAADADICDADSNFLVYPEGHPSAGELVFPPNDTGFYSELRGGINVVDLNLSANIEDRVYIGATLGYHIVDYSRFSYYYEADDYGEIYSLENNYKVGGSGIDFKIGAIFRPFKYSPFKVALSLHTPVFYNMTDISNASIIGPEKETGYPQYKTQSADCYGDDLLVAYSLRTPWRLGAAMSYTFGNFLAVNAEYEYADASSMSFSNRGDVAAAQNEEILSNLKPQHTLRIGAELSVKKFAFRAGYNYISAPYNKDAFKYMYNAAITETSTEYMNKYDKNIATVGLGYAGKLFYFDLAYMYQVQKSDFYPYHDMDYVSPVATVKTTGHSFLAGVGVRF